MFLAGEAPLAPEAPEIPEVGEVMTSPVRFACSP
jgi:hypothetical protein